MFLQFIENTIKVFTIEQGNDFSLTRAPGVRRLADTFHLDARVHKGLLTPESYKVKKRPKHPQCPSRYCSHS
jgi:hypothetical protein